MASNKNTQIKTDSNYQKFEGYSVFMRSDNIIELLFENYFNGELDDAKNMVEGFKKIKGKQKACLLVIYAEYNTFSKEAREFIATDEVSKIIKAEALVMKGLALRIIGNGYLRINKPKRPTKIFNTIDEAAEWLTSIC